MRHFSGTIMLTLLIMLAALLLACAGARSGSEATRAEVKEETLTAASPAPPPEPSPPGQPAMKDATGTASVQRSDKIKFMYEDIYFKRGSIKLDPAAKALLDKKAAWLEANPDVKVVLEGHTDYKGSKEYNLALGDRRSGAVKSYLMGKGIARERLIAISYGREKPAVTAKTEKDRAKNRRVHFVIEQH